MMKRQGLGWRLILAKSGSPALRGLALCKETNQQTTGFRLSLDFG